ncbi:hypothetical protein EJ06DRAFT_529182 [Trichodelitschia bisporula]|uniref:Uncharacterized protein n=1 Tax=Trichodelitschia bisporula TaxID=703511 RepID=A0A6G1I249_9PEZI|nr:hypothetical protein EJ06DRAFT_529182 [Trichodelitschia bisporula]
MDLLTRRPLRPFHNDVAIATGPGRCQIVDQRVLQAYLPGLAQLAEFKRVIDLRPIILQLMPFLHPVDTKALMEAMHILLTSLARHVGPSEIPALDIMEALETTFEREYLSLYPNFQHTFRLFKSFADIAALGRSNRIRRVLCQFFAKHGAAITLSLSPGEVLNWARTVLLSGGREIELAACLREIIIARGPLVLEELSRVARTTAGLQVCRSIAEVLQRVDIPALDFPGGRGLHLGRRPPYLRPQGRRFGRRGMLMGQGGLDGRDALDRKVNELSHSVHELGRNVYDLARRQDMMEDAASGVMYDDDDYLSEDDLFRDDVGELIL